MSILNVTSMEISKHSISKVMTIQPLRIDDSRGYFYESFNKKSFERVVGNSFQFVQDNHTRSLKNVLRGLHYQINRPQGKLVRVIKGAIFDVAVDLRKSSSSFGQWVGQILSDDNFCQLWIPAGFAHGYLAMTDGAEVIYKTTEYYAPEYERSISWCDPQLAIKWPINSTPILSIKDGLAGTFAEADKYA